MFNVWFCKKLKYPGDECYINTIIQYVNLILYTDNESKIQTAQ